MFFFTRRRGRAFPRAAFLGCAIRILLLPRPRGLALARDAHPPWALAGPRVRLRPLAVHREPAAVAEPAPPDHPAPLTHRLYGRSYLHPQLAGRIQSVSEKAHRSQESDK